MIRRRNTVSPKKFSAINVTSLVDVTLVLLIIFMITTPTMDKGLEIDLPKVSAGIVEKNDEPLILNITKENKLFISETETPIKNLDERLKLLLKQKKNKTVFLKADKNVSYGFVTQIISQIQKSGIAKLALLTDLEEEIELKK